MLYFAPYLEIPNALPNAMNRIGHFVGIIKD
jgi:hypothetical protein